MSLKEDSRFTVTSLPIDSIPSGESILLTGEDGDALRSVFAGLLAAEDDEHSIILSTNDGGESMRRMLNGARRGATERSSVLACEGAAAGKNVTKVEDMTDLTALGMQFSNLVASAEQAGGRFRSGIFLCSSICAEVDDLRAVYRFLNTTFLTDLRRGDGLGVCAVDTSAVLETDVESMITGMETSMSSRIHVTDAGRDGVELDFTGFDDIEGQVTTKL